MLQQFSKKYKRKMWISMISRLKLPINPHDLLKFNNEPLYYKPYRSKIKIEVNTTKCLHCGTQLVVKFSDNDFVTHTCRCVVTPENRHATVHKLQSLFQNDEAKSVLARFSANKTRFLKNTMQYWTNQGLTNDEARKKISEVQQIRSAKSPSSKKGARGYSPRTIEYWRKQGLSESDAKKAVTNNQTTNGIAYYTAKYGIQHGTKLFNERIAKWHKSMLKMNAGISQISMSLFNTIDPDLSGYYGDKESTVRGKTKVHRVDYINKEQRKIIEFDGDYWHANPNKFSADSMIRKKCAKDIWAADAAKTKDLEDNGYDVLRIFESEYKNEPEQTITKCKDFLNENKHR